ncbi:MAG: hypothetical protein OXQ30_13865 [Boseongicola sp.]|nr:hypothetical protein [Boseongicola sp.]
MQDNTSSVSDAKAAGTRVVALGIAAVVLILGSTATFLLWRLPAADAFNNRVERLFIENTYLTSEAEIKLLEIIAQSGTIFGETLSSYRFVIFVLMLFATGLLIACFVFVVTIMILNRRIGAIERQGIQVSSLIISRDENIVAMNDMEFTLTAAAMETLSVLAEARMDGDVLTGAQIEAMISGKSLEDCEEAAGATRIKRLRDALGNQLVSELLIKTIARQGYVLSIDQTAIKML